MRVVTRVLVAAALVFGLGCAKTDWIDRTLLTETVAGAWTGSMHPRPPLHRRSDEMRIIGARYFITTGQQAMLMTTPEPIEGRVAGDMVTFKSG